MNGWRENASPFLRLTAGFALWSLAFVAIYATQAVGCALRWDTVALAGPLSALRALLVALFVAFLGAHSLLWLRFRGRGSEPAGIAGARLALAALASAAITFSGALWLSPC